MTTQHNLIGSGENMIVGLDHIAIAVSRLDEALQIYQNILGLKLEKTMVVEDQKVRLAFLLAGETKIELLEPTAAESTVARFIKKRGEGIHHIALKVTDIEGSLKQLKEKGIALVDEKPRVGAEGGKIAFLHPKSLKNVLIELCEE
jgi:methylmalonyl-CoA/ethylmalonyl-CoA epimerase